MKSFNINNIFPAQVVEVNYTDSDTSTLLKTELKILSSKTSGTIDTIHGYPLDSNIKRVPLKGEVVLVLEAPKYNSTLLSKSTDYYYLPYPVNIQRSVQHSSVRDLAFASSNGNSEEDRNAALDGVPRQSTTNTNSEADLGDNIVERDNVFPIQPLEGDVSIEGRFGNSIRLSNTQTNFSNYDAKKMPFVGDRNTVNDPIIILSNGHFKEQPPTEPGKFIKYKYEDIDKDASSLYLTTSQRVRFNPLMLDNFTPEAQQSENIDKRNTEPDLPQALLKSDRIVFSSNTETLMYSVGGIGLASQQPITLDSNSDIHMNAREIKLGLNPTEQAVLGNTLQRALNALIDQIAALTVPTGTGPSGPPVNAGQIRAIKDQIANALSQTVSIK